MYGDGPNVKVVYILFYSTLRPTTPVHATHEATQVAVERYPMRLPLAQLIKGTACSVEVASRAAPPLTEVIPAPRRATFSEAGRPEAASMMGCTAARLTLSWRVWSAHSQGSQHENPMPRVPTAR